jgi:spore coat polysaccharide biosynthesis predicted glycosyltransferase SpsG
MSKELDEFKEKRYSHIPGDFTYNELGFKNDCGQGIYSDISAHLPLLEFLASRCDHITEFGTRDCYSTIALIYGCRKEGKVVSYDIKSTPDIEFLLSKKDDLPCDWEFRLDNTIREDLEIEPTDLLLIDTLHTYDQVKKELELHANKVNQAILFHDTFSQGEKSLDIIGEPGINQAINEFLSENNWRITYQVQFNHGLVLMENMDWFI